MSRPVITVSDDLTHMIDCLWQFGCSTRVIAQVLGPPEAAIFNILSRLHGDIDPVLISPAERLVVRLTPIPEPPARTTLVRSVETGERFTRERPRKGATITERKRKWLKTQYPHNLTTGLKTTPCVTTTVC